jgi:hypothetical protein
LSAGYGIVEWCLLMSLICGVEDRPPSAFVGLAKLRGRTRLRVDEVKERVISIRLELKPRLER